MVASDPTSAQDLLGVVLVAPIAGERGEPEESERGEAVGRRRRVVEQVLRAGDELLAVEAGGEHAACLRVPEEVEHRVGRRDGLGDPPTLARGLGEGDERLHERCVVGRVTRGGERRRRAATNGAIGRRRGAGG